MWGCERDQEKEIESGRKGGRERQTARERERGRAVGAGQKHTDRERD